MQGVLVLDRTEVGAQHHVEVTRFGPLTAHTAIRAHDVGETVLRHLVAVLFGVGFLKLVGALTLVAVEAFDERIVEHGHVTGCDPHFRRQDDGGVDADHIAARDDHGTPPLALDVVFQRDTKRAVIPRGTGATVDFAGGEYEPATLGEGDDFIEFRTSHNAPSGLTVLLTY